MRAKSGIISLALWGCAALNTATMSGSCRDAYNACLNVCPSGNSSGSNSGLLNIGPGGVGLSPLQTELARCTERCNQQAKTCQSNELK
jgi:hypothetical protein